MAIEPKTSNDIKVDSIQGKSGSTVSMSSQRWTALGDATARTDALPLKQFQDGTPIWVGTTAGAGNTYTANATPAITAYVTGQVFRFLSDKTNSGAATLNINGVGAAALRDVKGVALASTYLQTGVIYEVLYDGTNFRLLATKPVQVSIVEGQGNINTTTGAFADYTGASVTLTTSAGDIVEVIGFINISATGAAQRIYMQVNQDGVDVSDNKSSSWVNGRSDGTGEDDAMNFYKIFQPAAGAHTYKIRWKGVATAFSDGYRLTVKVTPAS